MWEQDARIVSATGWKGATAAERRDIALFVLKGMPIDTVPSSLGVAVRKPKRKKRRIE